MNLRTMLPLLAGVCLLAADSPDAVRWWSHVSFLADDKLEGRDTGSAGHKAAVLYAAQEFERAGLKPAGKEGYRQPVDFRSVSLDELASSLSLLRDGTAIPLKLGEDAYFGLRGNVLPEVDAEMVFAGYGFAVPEQKYDELAGLDVKNKVVVYLSGGPKSIPGPLLSHYQSAEQRWKTLKQAGAIGVATIANPRTSDIPWERARMSRLLPSMKLAEIDSDGPGCSIAINPARVDFFFEGTGHTLNELLDLATAGQPLPKFGLKGRIQAKVKLNASELISDNVVGLKEGTHPTLKKEYVVLSAHIDHVGVGKTLKGDQIYNGAMDNASGIASLIEIAGALKNAKTARSVLFVAVTGEEKGLLGSQYFAQLPTVPREAIAADLNFDMFLPLYAFKRLTVYGLDESTLGDTVRKVAAKAGIEVQRDPEPQRNSFIRSDQYSFIRRGIPALAFKVGYAVGSPEEKIFKAWLKERYHAVSDDLQQPVDKEAAVKFNRLMASIATAVANDPVRPHWNDSSFFKRFAP
jgi:hypothetical protein